MLCGYSFTHHGIASACLGVLGEGLCVMQPCMVFAGEQFENDADFKLAKSMLLDMFRGRVVEKINLKVLALCFSSYSDCGICEAM